MKHFKICGYLEIPENLNWASHVVSIWSKGKRPDDLHFPQPSKRVCQVDFDDIDRPEGYRLLSGEMMHPPTARDVSRILEFTAHVPSDAQVLFHCAAGVSRSAAAAFLALCQRQPEVHSKRHMVQIWRRRWNCWPNTLIVQYGDRLLHRKGELVETLEWFQELQKMRLFDWAEKTFERDPEDTELRSDTSAPKTDNQERKTRIERPC